MLLLILTGVMATSGYRAGLLYQSPTANTYPTQVHPGDEGVFLEVELTNNFNFPYENVTTRLEPQGPFKGIKTENFISDIRPNGQKSMFYKVNIDSNAEPGEYLLNHYMTYSYTEYDEDGEQGTYTIEVKKTVAVEIYFSEKLDLASVGLTEREILPNEETQLLIKVKNTGSVPVSDVIVSYAGLTTTATIITAAGASSATTINFLPLESTKKTIPSIQPDQEIEISFLLRALRNTEIKAYELPVTVTYGDQTLTDSAVVNVKGKPDVRLAGLQNDESLIFQGQAFSVSVQLENIGTGDAKSVKAKIISDNISGIKTAYIGTIDVEDTGTAIFDLKDYNPGNHELTIEITYEDMYGNEQPPFQFKTEYSIYERPPDYSGVFILVGVVLIIIYLIYRRWKKKKELEQLVN